MYDDRELHEKRPEIKRIVSDIADAHSEERDVKEGESENDYNHRMMLLKATVVKETIEGIKSYVETGILNHDKVEQGNSLPTLGQSLIEFFRGCLCSNSSVHDQEELRPPMQNAENTLAGDRGLRR